MTQSFTASFNDPIEAATTFSARVNILGQTYEKMLKKAKRFMEDHKIKKAHYGREILFFAQLEIETSKEAWDEVQPALNAIKDTKLKELKK